MILIKQHHNISVEDIPKTWGYLSTYDTQLDNDINLTIINVLSHYTATQDMKLVFETLKILDEKYEDCEIYAKETIGLVFDYMISCQYHDRNELRFGFDKYFWNE